MDEQTEQRTKGRVEDCYFPTTVPTRSWSGQRSEEGSGRDRSSHLPKARNVSGPSLVSQCLLIGNHVYLSLSSFWDPCFKRWRYHHAPFNLPCIKSVHRGNRHHPVLVPCSVFMSSRLGVSPKYSGPSQLLISVIWVLKLVDVKLLAAFQGHSPSDSSADYAGTGGKTHDYSPC